MPQPYRKKMNAFFPFPFIPLPCFANFQGEVKDVPVLTRGSVAGILGISTLGPSEDGRKDGRELHQSRRSGLFAVVYDDLNFSFPEKMQNCCGCYWMSAG